MPEPTLALDEALWLLDETAHQLAVYYEDNETWTPLEEALSVLDLVRWLVDLERDDAGRGEPPLLRPV